MSETLQEHPAISEADGPGANGDPMGTPAMNERVLWKGRPSLPALARTAFHTRSFAVYFLALIALAAFLGNYDSALFLAGLGLLGWAMLYFAAWLSWRSTLYILTDVRLILRIGMAVETRINVPLKHIEAAHLNMRGRQVGDIAAELGGERLLGYFLLWPHVRPFRFARPQPMLRAIPEPQDVAQKLADACAKYHEIERNLTQVKDASAQSPKPVSEPAMAKTVSSSDRGAGSDGSLTGAPA